MLVVHSEFFNYEFIVIRFSSFCNNSEDYSKIQTRTESFSKTKQKPKVFALKVAIYNVETSSKRFTVRQRSERVCCG